MFHRILGFFACCSAFLNLAAAPDIVVADFEGETYGDWTATGEAFGKGPAHGTLPGQMQVDGFLGKGLVNSFLNGDRTTGTLTSPEFKLERPYLAFLIGGGGYAGKTCMNLLLDGKVVRTATGPNTVAGGSERLGAISWDVSEFVGKSVRLQIVDAATGGWGHINVDHIVATDKKPPVLLKDAQRELVASSRYLHLPVKNGAPKRQVAISVNGRVERAFEIELADEEPDWWAFTDITPFKGRKLTITVDQLRDDSAALKHIGQGDTIKGGENLYAESQRAQFHFSPMRGWNNDPNGFVYYEGEWHLFFQHNPYGWGWGNMHWGHAVSSDLMHWQEIGEALYPDELGTMFSGSAVVDWKNTSGLGKAGKPPLVLIYTAAGGTGVQSKGKGFSQCVAYSNDKGRTWTKYSGNPVLPQITGGNRDPKVFWHEPTKHWVMTLYVERDKKHTIEFFASPDLKKWELMSSVEGLFECPDFFALPVDGNIATKKWVLTAASSEYMIGTFDGTKFTPETPKLPGHRGRGFYAAQTYSDAPDGRRIQIGWFQTETKGMPFNQSMTIPLELGLTSTPNGPRLTYAPVHELQHLRSKTHHYSIASLKPGDKNPLDDLNAELVEVRAEFTPGDASEVVFNIRDAMVIYDVKKQELSVNGQRAPAPLRDGRQRVTIYCDRTGLEVFASDGLTYMPMPFNTNPDHCKLYFEARGGTASIHALEVHELRSVWPAVARHP